MIKLSVIIPCYNVEKYLEKCIESVLNNKTDNLEIILVNDGSTDDTLKIIKRYIEKYPNKIKYIDQENQGLSIARNNGVSKASGEYVTFLDSDDFVDENMYVKFLEKMESNEFDIVTCGVKMIYETHEVNVGPGYDYDLLNKETIKNNMYRFYPAACNKAFKKILFNIVKFKESVAYEDVEFIYRLLPNIKSVGVIDGYYYNYIQRAGSITYTFNEKLLDLVYNCDSIVKYYKDHNLFDEYHDEIEYTYVRYLYATFLKRVAKTKNKKKYDECVKLVKERVKKNFPNYRKNRYLNKTKTGIYLKLFNQCFANIIYHIEKNKLN